ncbi:hypothetical protein OS493_001862 [Desmophyllum pertusum]|uniref:Uncharacterized protein n=1 Tax=Desmophyllum pertusum TaxID=174260 RepID=A0A9W9Z656_9CNID|nr:hypothetical protein OS493_001862 [Desmophyllum pertusum]
MEYHGGQQESAVSHGRTIDSELANVSHVDKVMGRMDRYLEDKEHHNNQDFHTDGP